MGLIAAGWISVLLLGGGVALDEIIQRVGEALPGVELERLGA